MDETLGPLVSVVDRFAKELVQERIDGGHLDVQNMSFAERRRLSHQMTPWQSALYSDDSCCPACEARHHTRTIHVIGGATGVVELKSFCPHCRRSFFPVRNMADLDGRSDPTRARPHPLVRG